MDIRVLRHGVLELRPVALTDADEWLAGEDDEQIRWFEAPGPADLRNVKAAIERWSESWEVGGPVHHWGIRHADTDALMGGVEVRDLGDEVFNLSYLVFPPFRRRGVATAASALAIDAAHHQMGARTIRVKVLEDNVASLAVARRLGGAAVGTEPSDSAGGTFVVFELELGTD